MFEGALGVTLFPCTTLFRSDGAVLVAAGGEHGAGEIGLLGDRIDGDGDVGARRGGVGAFRAGDDDMEGAAGFGGGELEGWEDGTGERQAGVDVEGGLVEAGA